MAFDIPGRARDFAEPAVQEKFGKAWHELVSGWFDGLAEDRLAFFNPMGQGAPAQTVSRQIVWEAFPRVLQDWYRGEPDFDERRWSAADTLKPLRFFRRTGQGPKQEITLFHRQQDEYCEWFLERDEDGEPKAVVMTSEAPEYWSFLGTGEANGVKSAGWDGDRDRLLALYHELVGPNVKMSDLFWRFDVVDEAGDLAFVKGDYNPYNKWNTRAGLVHLTHPANTLHAEIALAADAAVPRARPDGTLVTKDLELICCGGYGEPNRSSDPSIGAQVNGLVRSGFLVSLADPVGLYIADFEAFDITGPNGYEAERSWTVVRGDAASQKILRLRFEPVGAKFDQLSVLGKPLRYAAQLADLVRVNLVGLAAKNQGAKPAAQRCDAKCCNHPERPDFQAGLRLSGSCGSVDWRGLAPVEPAATPGAALALGTPAAGVRAAARRRRAVPRG